MIRPKKIIVVGGNAAGAAAAAKAKRLAPETEILMFESSSFISTGTCELPYIFSGEINSPKDLVFFDANSFKKEKGVNVFTNHRVESIDRKNKFVMIKNLISGHSYKENYDKLILATGSKAVSHPQLYSNYRNVFNLKSVQDAINILKINEKKNFKRTAIIGAGLIGLECAESFSKNGTEVLLIDSAGNPLSNNEDFVQNSVTDLLKQNNIKFFPNERELKFSVKDEIIKSLTLSGWSFEIDLIITAIGFEPNNQLAIASRLSLNENGTVKVNNKLQTDDPNIYACGDLISSICPITNKNYYTPLATSARKSGYTAGENAVGGNKIYSPSVRNISLRFFNRNFAFVGLNFNELKIQKEKVASVESTAFNKVEVMPGADKVFGKIYFVKESKKILRAVFIGGQEVSGYLDILSILIKEKIPLNRLGEYDFNYTPAISPFNNLLNILGKKVSN